MTSTLGKDMACIAHIYTAKDRGSPLESHTEVFAKVSEGIVGDRYCDAKNRKSDDYQITFIEAECITAFEEETGLKMSAGAPRRNLVTSGVRLNDFVGKRFFVGEAKLEGLERCEPCRLFSSRTYPEALPWFVSKGGLRARIIESGRIRVGDEIKKEPNQSPEPTH